MANLAATITPVKESASDKARNRIRRDRICMGRSLYRGAWRQLLKDLSAFTFPSIKRHSGKVEELMAKVNAFRLAVITHTKFLALADPTVTIPDEFAVQKQRWAAISSDCLFPNRFVESILKQYREAESWWRITANDGSACLSVPDSLQVYPIGEFGHDDQPRMVDLRWVITRVVDRRERHYLRVERHTSGQIENFAYEVSSRFACDIPETVRPLDLREVLGDAAPEPVQSTGVDRPLLFRAALMVVDDCEQALIEKEDFDIIDANAKSLSQLLMNQDRHGSPLLRVAEGHLEKDGSFDASKRARTDPDKQLEYIDFDAKLDLGLDAFARILRYLMIQLEMSPELIGLKEGAAAESYEKLMLQSVVTTSRAHLTKANNEPVLERVIETALRFDAHLHPLGYPVAPVDVALHPGLPRTPDEVNRGLAEQHAARQIDGLSMLERIHGAGMAKVIHERLAEEDRQRTESLIGAGLPSAALAGGGEPGEVIPDETEVAA